MISKRLVFGCACIMALMLWPTQAAAQRRRPAPVRVRTAVVVNAGFYRPYYYSPFFYPYYSPFWFGFGLGPFYDPFYDGWYPLYAQYPRYPYPGYYYGGAWSSARIQIKPKDAQVYLDGYFVGIVDQFDGVFQRLDIPGGEHELAVYMPGFRTYRERALFRPGQSYHFKAILEPLPAGAPPEPKPQPQPPAQPQAGAYPPNGPDPYRRDPYEQDPTRQPPPPPPGRGRTMPPPERGGEMRRAPEGADFGTLSVRVQPADAVVVVDGERWDSPEGGSRIVVQLPAGPHRVEVRKDGFKPYSSTIQIRPGETQTLNISLPRIIQH